MTRRKFFRTVAKAASATMLGAIWLARKAAPRRFVRAGRLPSYPGPLKPLGDIRKPGKWGG